MSVQDLARSLVAAGSARFPNDEEEQVYLAHVRDGNLVEKLWVGDDAKSEGVIATDAKEDTTVSYLFNAGQGLRLAVFIDQSNTVQCYAYNEEIEEWEQTGLGKKWNITTSPNSKLSASFGPKGSVVVSYQDTAGRLAGVMSVAEDKWEPFTHPEADPVAGTPQCLENIDDKMHLFYVRNDGSLRYLVLNYDTGKWQGQHAPPVLVNVLKNTQFDTPIDNFCVAKNPESGSFQSYFLIAGSLWNVDGDKEKTRLGRVEENGKLIPSDNAQAGRRVWWSGARYVKITRNTIRIWY